MENIRIARCSRVVLSKLLAVRKAIFFISARASSQKNGSARNARKCSSRHPLNYFRVHTILLTLVAVFAFQVTFLSDPFKGFPSKMCLLYFLSTNKVPSLPEVSLPQCVKNESYYSAIVMRPKMLLN